MLLDLQMLMQQKKELVYLVLYTCSQVSGTETMKYQVQES